MSWKLKDSVYFDNIESFWNMWPVCIIAPATKQDQFCVVEQDQCVPSSCAGTFSKCPEFFPVIIRMGREFPLLPAEDGLYREDPMRYFRFSVQLIDFHCMECL